MASAGMSAMICTLAAFPAGKLFQYYAKESNTCSYKPGEQCGNGNVIL